MLPNLGLGRCCVFTVVYSVILEIPVVCVVERGSLCCAEVSWLGALVCVGLVVGEMPATYP